VLTLLSRDQESGSSILRKIDEVTEYAWNVRGTIYPLLESLEGEGLVKTSRTKTTESKVFSLTPKGKQSLARASESFSMLGRSERAVMRLITDLLPSKALLPLIANRLRESGTVLKQRIPEIPGEERDLLLRELQLIYSSQLDWVNSQLHRNDEQK
jgi:DNA-binding PadR family transcriptional regulator